MKKKGYIFLCNEVTEAECLERGLFGGMVTYAKSVKELEKGDALFLYNYSTKQLHGSFVATSKVRENIAPKAWGGEFPLQVKVKRVKKHKPLTRDDIREDTYLNEHIRFQRGMFPTAKLSPETVEHLESIFSKKKRAHWYEDSRQHHADDGHIVRSKAELKIDNWLYKHRIVHAYETMIPGAKRCDFEIPRAGGSIYIEFWGLNDKKYLKDKAAKKKIYKENNLELIELERKDLKYLDKILGSKLLGK